ncbi:uncharacterized protein A1O9_08295 [Exophiala aquamarina CBS 119918]|uniref:Kinase n=1 Tax=Exophiala aquamarina CBS 119918 TaxID=1182545 RepID=A0A072PJ30_9EURO|nr:uncharacterized protein A1O9_08295 [Exophiala aquamarina CBS 119918]KEF55545.1 hypothetical protein A1O9_08295 [Exophiala aquamarina CBS 119918]
MTSSQPPAKKLAAAVPNASELVSFEHGAAGHQGISSNASGSLVIKPCVQAEIDFYESAKEHPLFQAHMPTFIGSLTQNGDADGSETTVAPLLEQAGGIQVPAAICPPQNQTAGTGAPGVTVTSPTPGLIKRATWKPSGGQKLTTGLAIVLENVTSGFKHPNVLDVKLGARLWDDDAPITKRRKLDEVAEQTTSGSLGFRVAGMKVHLDGTEAPAQQETPEPNVEVKNGYKSYNKNYGRGFDKDSVVDAFTTFLGGVTRDDALGKVRFKKSRGELIAKRILRELESIQYALENEEIRMYSASILLVYEGDDEALQAGLKFEEEVDGQEQEEQEEEADDDEDDDEITQKVLEARLIDFAHASWTPGQGPDENALRGIRNVVKIMKDLLD